jgi:hypothetical protein
VQVRGGGVAFADLACQRGDQVRASGEHPGQGALGQVESVMGQRGRDPMGGPAQHELLHQQPGQKPRGEPALADRLRYRWRGQHPADRAAATAPVGRAADHDPYQPHLPVDQLATLFAERDIPGPAARAHPFGFRHVANVFLG